VRHYGQPGFIVKLVHDMLGLTQCVGPGMLCDRYEGWIENLQIFNPLQKPVLADGRFGRKELKREAFTLFVYSFLYLHPIALKTACLRPKTTLILHAPKEEIKIWLHPVAD
jgi:hypothetical protein